MTDEEVEKPPVAEPMEPHAPTPTPRPIVMLFAAAFVVAMGFNLQRGGSDTVTIFLGAAALLVLGVDVGKIIGRR